MKTSSQPRLTFLPIHEHPANRICEAGASSASLVELLAAIIGSHQQIETAERLVAQYPTLGDLYQAQAGELEHLPGIGHATAARIKAALELGKRLSQEIPDRPRGNTPTAIANLVMAEMSALDREEMRVVLLNTKSRVMQISTVYMGNVQSAIIRPAEVFQDAVRLCASSIVLVHNHPTGDPSPSPDDVEVTKHLVSAGKVLDIDVQDHLVIGGGRFVSLRAQHSPEIWE